MKFEIDTEAKTITLKEDVKLSDLQSELKKIGIELDSWEVILKHVEHIEIEWKNPPIPHIQPFVVPVPPIYPTSPFPYPDTYKITC